MKVEVRERAAVTIVDVDGQITFETVPELREKMLGAVAKRNAVLINLSQVSYMDSSGIATLVEGLKTAKGQEGAFGLFGLNKNTRNVLELVRLDKIFQIFESEDEAVRRLSASSSGS